MNTTITDHTDPNTMTMEQTETFVLERILAAKFDAQAAETKTLIDAMENKTALRFYGQVCGLLAMSAAASDDLNTIISLKFLIDTVAQLLKARGYHPQMQSGLEGF